MGLFDYFEEAVDAVGDAAVSVGEAVVDVAEVAVEVTAVSFDATTDVIGAAGVVVAETVDVAVTVTDTVTGGGASAVLDAVDDVVLDTVDTVTGGVVNIDLDDGTFSASVGVDGVFDASASVGRNGVSADSSVLDQGIGGSVGRDGVSSHITAGVNYGYLPYVDGELDVRSDGAIHVDGEIQGTIPTPYGLLSGEVQSEFTRTEDQFSVGLDVEGQLLTASGITIGGEVAVAYADGPDGSSLQAQLGGFVSKAGIGRVEAEVGYSRVEEDGVVVEGYHAAASAQGYGIEVSASVDHLVATAADGQSVSVTETAAAIDVDLGNAFSTADSTESSVGDLFADL